MTTAWGGQPTGSTGTHYGGSSKGLLGSLAPADGLDGPSPLARLLGPGDLGAEWMFRVVTRPVGITGFSIGEDSACEGEGAAGLHPGAYQLYRNGALVGGDAFNFQIGTGVLSGGATLDGDATGGGFVSQLPGTLGGALSLGDGGAGGGMVGSVVAIARPPRNSGFTVVPRRVVRLAAIDPQEVPDLSPMAPGDVITLEFDFSPYASVAGPDLVVARQGGDDGLPALSKVGAYYVQDNLVLQRYTAPPEALGSTYLVTCTATVPGGDRLTAIGRLPVGLD